MEAGSTTDIATKHMDAELEPLAPEERRFVEEYLIDRNGTRAYRAVHGPNQSYSTASKAASRLVRKTHIAAEIRAAEEHLRERCEITAERVIEEIAAIAFADVGDFIDYTAEGLPRLKPGRQVSATSRKSLKKVKVKTRRLRGGGDVAEEIEDVEVELHDKLSALDKLCKHLGILRDEAPLLTLLKELSPELRRKVMAELKTNAG